MGDPKPGSAALKVLFRHLAAQKNSKKFPKFPKPPHSMLRVTSKREFFSAKSKKPCLWLQPMGNPPRSILCPQIPSMEFHPIQTYTGTEGKPPAKVGTVLRRSGAASKRSWYFRKCWGISDIFAEHPWLCTGMHSFLSLVFPVFFMDFFA